MQIAVFVDSLMLLPVVAFLLWLFWYTAPGGRLPWQKRADIGLALLACGVTAGVFAGLHSGLDIEGMDRSMIVVAMSYLTFVVSMGASWIFRWRLHTSPSSSVNDGPTRGT